MCDSHQNLLNVRQEDPPSLELGIFLPSEKGTGWELWLWREPHGCILNLFGNSHVGLLLDFSLKLPPLISPSGHALTILLPQLPQADFPERATMLAISFLKCVKMRMMMKDYKRE